MTHQINYQLVASTLKQARIKSGYTQNELAKKSGMTKGAISQWESGKPIDYKADKFLHVCKTLGLDPYALLYSYSSGNHAKTAPTLNEPHAHYSTQTQQPILDAIDGLDTDAINALAHAIKSIRKAVI